MSKTTHLRRKHRGFTLIELIATLSIGLLMVSLLIQLGFFLEHGPESVEMVATQYEAFGEVEDMVGDYRAALDNGALDLNNLLDNWGTDPSITISQQTISVTATDNSHTFQNVKRVQISKGGMSATIYLTE